MTRTVAVIGASGRQGGAQVRQLAAAGFNVKALSRSADPFYGAEKPDSVEVVAADLYDEASLEAAFQGAEAVFHTHPLRARQDRAVLVASVGRAAKAAGVKRVVWNTSSWIPDRPGDPYTYAGNTEGINALWRTGVGGTVFGSVLFMDNLLTNWARPSIVDEGKFVYAHRPDLEANWISLDDVAKIMIHSLDRPDMEGAWINIGGPERLKPAQVAAAISPALGRTITYEPCTPEEFSRRLHMPMATKWGLRSAQRSRTRSPNSITTTTLPRPGHSRSTPRRCGSASRSSSRQLRPGRSDRTGATPTPRARPPAEPFRGRRDFIREGMNPVVRGPARRYRPHNLQDVLVSS